MATTTDKKRRIEDKARARRISVLAAMFGLPLAPRTHLELSSAIGVTPTELGCVKKKSTSQDFIDALEISRNGQR